MKKIISISRRTDIPAFYGDWLMRRLEAGFAGWENPYNRRKIITSLVQEDVAAFVLWSKDFRPFLRHLPAIKASGIPTLFHYTITGLPRVFEGNVSAADDAVATLHEISALFSPEQLVLRYDPIIITDHCDEAYHRATFSRLAGQLRGAVRRCYISFVTRYGKVENQFRHLHHEQGITVITPTIARQAALAGELAAIAAAHGIELYSCCNDHLLVDPRLKKGHCVDGELLTRLYPDITFAKGTPTRNGCGCAASTDIGSYDSCPHGCLYCYANRNKERAELNYRRHDPEAAFLGYTKEESAGFLQEIRQARKDTPAQPVLL
jgi:hypothetical protein